MTVAEDLDALVLQFASAIGAVGTSHLETPYDNWTAIDSFTAVIGVGHELGAHGQELRLDELRTAEGAARSIAWRPEHERALGDALERLRIAWYSTLRLPPAEIEQVRDYVEGLGIAPQLIARVVAWTSRP